MSISIDVMKTDLLTVDEVQEKLSQFEPFTTLPLTKESSVSFQVDPEWNLTVDTLRDTDPVDVFVTIDGVEKQLTKEALGQLSSSIGLPMATVKKAPHDAVEGFLNRLYRDPSKDMKVLSVGDRASAMAPATITPFSNVELLDSVVDRLKHTYGGDAEILADYKITNTLTRTDIRLIVPQESRRMRDTYMDDVPGNAYDDWAAGVHLSNSLVGKSQTFVDTYLFRWWCTNGCTTENTSVGTWDRRHSGDDPADVVSWVTQAVDSALEHMEDKFDQIQSLASLQIADAEAVVSELFAQYNLPARQRREIGERAIRNQHMTLYSLAQAVTQQANEPGMSGKDVERLLRIGGIVSFDATLDPQKARIWDAGHHAPSGANNPFSMRRV